MRLLGVTRVAPPLERLDASQPRTWTFIGFEVNDDDAQELADVLSRVMSNDQPWYCNFATTAEMWVVFAEQQFHYPHGDIEGRMLARDFARRQGVPEPQLDWD